MGFAPPGFNRLGGSLPAERNIISGNQNAGITVAGDKKYVLGNFVGCDITGTKSSPTKMECSWESPGTALLAALDQRREMSSLGVPTGV